MSMSSSTDALLAQAGAFAAVWAEASDAGISFSTEEGVAFDVERMPDAELLRTVEAGFALKRTLDGLLTRAAGQVVSRSRSSLGDEGLAKRKGDTSAAALLADLGHISMAEAARFCRVGEATASRVTLLGAPVPAEYPVVGAALDAGAIPLDSAQSIIAALAQASPRADRADVEFAEQTLVDFAGENPADIVRKLAVRVRDQLDTDGIEPREEELIERRRLRRTILPNGMKRYLLELDPLSAGYLDAVLDAVVGSAIRAPRTAAGRDPDGCDSDHETLVDGRTLEQIGADAIIDLARHGMSCTDTSAPLANATIVVRMSLESLMSGLGEAQIDGIEQPISAGAARRLAAEARIIPLVFGGKSEVLDLGVGRRLFSKAQRIAFGERDDGCAWGGCQRPGTYTEAHHIRWWEHDGPSNLANGILLCSCHHHLVHRDGWGIVVKNGVPWFIPPDSVDVYRTPRRGGRLALPVAAGTEQ